MPALFPGGRGRTLERWGWSIAVAPLLLACPTCSFPSRCGLRPGWIALAGAVDRAGSCWPGASACRGSIGRSAAEPGAIARDPDSSGAHGGRDDDLRGAKPGGTDVVERLSRGLGTQGQDASSEMPEFRSGCFGGPSSSSRTRAIRSGFRSRTRESRFFSGRWDDHAMALLFPFFQLGTLLVLVGWLRRRGTDLVVALARGGLRGELRHAVFGLARPAWRRFRRLSRSS